MKKILPFALCSLFLLGACGERPRDKFEMTCGDMTISARVFKDRLEAKISDDVFEDEITLKISEAASGARYVGMSRDSLFILWNKGRDWLLLTSTDDKEEVFVCIRN